MAETPAQHLIVPSPNLATDSNDEDLHKFVQDAENADSEKPDDVPISALQPIQEIAVQCPFQQLLQR
jgi:hypothetical protein